MPSQRPCAAFEPISPDLDVAALVESTPNFEYVVRIHCDMIDHQGRDQFEKLVLLHVVIGGKPLVVEGYHERLDRWTFALQWLRDNCGTRVEQSRDLTKKTNLPLTINHYLNNINLLTKQWNAQNYKDPERQRIYLKDIDCPPLWQEKLKELVPQGLFYFNESTGEQGGLGSLDEPDPRGGGTKKGRGIAKAGDLMSSLPAEMRAENMMCYIGHEGTYTPAHREMCASLGQNIMVETSTGGVENGEQTKPGSSIWFMTETNDRHTVSEYWLSRLGHDMEVENHFAQINAWKAAPFTVHVVEQRVGDFILIPPMAPHQVWNRGTRTMKAAWNRTTVETLEMALDEALPASRMVCRDEQYKNKAIVYFTMVKYSQLIKIADKERRKIAKMNNGIAPLPSKIRQLHKDFKRLHVLYTRILVSENFLPEAPEKNVERIPSEGNVICSYCRCNIFNKFLTCPSCVGDLGNGEQDTYDICMECYAMGRSCACTSKLRWVEQFDWGDLVQKHDAWRHQIIGFEGEVNEKSPKALKAEIQIFGRRTLAQICQLELKKRPWKDITKPEKPEKRRNTLHEEEEEIEVDDEGRVKKRKVKVRRSEKWLREHKSCHLCCYMEPSWKQAHCSCGYSYCYGSLFRGFDMMPQTILEDPDWKCPRCLKICGCARCRKDPSNHPHVPAGTHLGHDTKKVADPRSVESLVDFSFSNIHWLKKAGDADPKDSSRLKQRAREAEAAKSQQPQLSGEHYVSEEDAMILRLAEQEGIPIDPALGVAGLPEGEVDPDVDETGSVNSEDRYRENPEQALPERRAGRAPPTPQYVVPDGGIIRDLSHAYEYTDAITYDYPDPDGLAQTQTDVAPLVDATQPSGAENVPGYEVAEAPSDIEMIVPKKRKRQSEGIITSKKSKTAVPDSAQPPKVPKPMVIRKFRSKTDDRTIDGKPSLLVKLGVRKSALEELNQRIVDRTSAPIEEAPKVASDLQALNAEAGRVDVPAAVPAKKAQIVRTEADDDFVISKRKDKRRKVVENLPQPDRRMRARVVEYISDPSDVDEDAEDDDDVEISETQQSAGNNDAAANGHQNHADSVQIRPFASFDQEDDANTSSANATPAPNRRSQVGGKFPSMRPPTQRTTSMYSSDASASSSKHATPSEDRTPSAVTPSRNGKAKANGTSKRPSMTTEQLAANRAAKLAALEWAEGADDW